MTIFARNNRASTLPNGTPAIATQEETVSEAFYMHVLQVGYGESPTPFPTSFYTAELDDADTDEDEDDLTEEVDLDDEDMDDEVGIDDDDFADEDFADEDDVKEDDEESTDDDKL